MEEIDFENLNETEKNFFNTEAIDQVRSIMNKFDLDYVYFNGGGLIKQPLLKKELEIDDWDMHLIENEDETVFEKFENLKKISKIHSLRKNKSNLAKGSFSTKESLVFMEDNKKIDFQLKREGFNSKKFCTFDIDSLSIRIEKDIIKVENYKALKSIEKRKAKLSSQRMDIYRILRRSLILIAKYDIKKFFIDKENIIDMNFDNSKVMQRLEKLKFRNNEIILQKTERNKASCLTKLFCMSFRVKNIYDYIKKINQSCLLKYIFPHLSEALQNEKFLQILAEESNLPEKDRKLNSTQSFVKKILEYNKNNINLANELILVEKDKYNKIDIDILKSIIKKGGSLNINYL